MQIRWKQQTIQSAGCTDKPVQYQYANRAMQQRAPRHPTTTRMVIAKYSKKSLWKLSILAGDGTLDNGDNAY
jgi:hypothetical protein